MVFFLNKRFFKTLWFYTSSIIFNMEKMAYFLCSERFWYQTFDFRMNFINKIIFSKLQKFKSQFEVFF